MTEVAARICVVCEQPFVSADWRARMCSAACREERRRQIEASYYARHAEARKANTRAWCRRNGKRWSAICGKATRKRRAVAAGASTVESIDRTVVYVREAGLCHLCGESVSPAEFELEHVVPVSRGGSHTYDNVRIAHPSCNRIKGTRLIEELVA